MKKKRIFLSVGRQGTQNQIEFVAEIKRLLELSGFEVFSLPSTYENPLDKVIEEMAKCDASIVVCFERIYAEKAQQFRNGDSVDSFSPLKIPTVWNHVEAALTKYFKLPTLIIAEHGCRPDGVLDPAVQFKICWTDINAEAVKSEHFKGIFSGWRNAVDNHRKISTNLDLDAIAQASTFEVLKRLKWSHWALLFTIGGMMFSLGKWVGGLN